MDLPYALSKETMHELSVAMRIVEALEAELADAPELQVAVVNLHVGALTGVVPEALEFSWDFASQNTRLQGSKLDIQVIPAQGRCPQCRVERTITNIQSFRCPVCHAFIEEISGGNELEILTLEVHDLEESPKHE